MNSAGTVVVCLGGVNEVMIGKREDDSLRVIPVGQRPTAVTFSRNQKTAFVANTFEDSISLVDIASEKQSGVIRLANERPRSLLERGEELFYDARFSHEGWMSCHSCHVDGHSNFTRNDNLSDGGFGAPKLVLSLLGRKHTAPFAWNASVDTLTEQVRNSLEKTMQTDHAHIPEADVQALAAYIESLPAPPNVDKLRGKLDQAAVQRGQAIFTQRECAQCHAPPHFTVARVEDVRLPDEMGKRLFNPPTLRGISQRDAFFHDGRALSLKDVFWKHNHPADHVWSVEEVRDLVAYLRSL
jgi:cytochrome c peroxidase